MSSLYYPASGYGPSRLFGVFRRFAFGRYVQREPKFRGQLSHLVSHICFVHAEMLGFLEIRCGPFDGDADERLLDHLAIGFVGALDCQTYREAVPID